VFLAAAEFFGATSCGVLRTYSESLFESLFESPSKANTYGMVGHDDTGHSKRETLAIYQHIALDGELEAKYQQAMKEAGL
jgi:hypothetical protein